MTDHINTLLGQVQILAEHGDWDISNAPVWLEVQRLARIGAAVEVSGEPFGYCEYCSGDNPTYKRARDETNVVSNETKTVIYLFCNDICADGWIDQQ